MKAIFIR